MKKLLLPGRPPSLFSRLTPALILAALLCASCENLENPQPLRNFTFISDEPEGGAALSGARAGLFSAEGGSGAPAYTLVSGEGSGNNGFFEVAVNALIIKAESLNEGDYEFRARVRDGKGQTLEEQFTLTVSPPEGPVRVTGVSLDQSQLTMALEGTAELQATVSPATAANKGLTWTSANPDIVTVEAGALSALATGAARITVRTDDGNKTARCAVTVWNFLDNLTAMNSWLGGLPDNRSSAPYYVALSGISVTERSGPGGLKDIFGALVGINKYTALNLDACSGATVGWNEAPGGHENWPGKDKVVHVVLPSSTTHIGYWSFANCVSLKSVVMPASVSAIGQYAFQGCTSLESVTCLAENPPQKGNANLGWFTGVAANFTIYVPRASVAAYKAAEGWSYYAAYIRAIE
jgi:hypothetical protein